MNFTNENMAIMRQEMNEALKTVADRHGLQFNIGTIRFESNNFRCKVECFSTNSAPSPLSQFAEGMGYPQVGKEYEIGDARNGRFKVKVLKNRRSKALCEITERVDYGTKRKCNNFQIGQQITVPFVSFKLNGKPELTEELKSKFRALAGQLSPENLTCDGELSGSQVRSRKNKIMREWQTLEIQAGTKVTESDVWSWR